MPSPPPYRTASARGGRPPPWTAPAPQARAWNFPPPASLWEWKRPTRSPPSIRPAPGPSHASSPGLAPPRLCPCRSPDAVSLPRAVHGRLRRLDVRHPRRAGRRPPGALRRGAAHRGAGAGGLRHRAAARPRPAALRRRRPLGRGAVRLLPFVARRSGLRGIARRGLPRNGAAQSAAGARRLSGGRDRRPEPAVAGFSGLDQRPGLGLRHLFRAAARRARDERVPCRRRSTSAWWR